jgi:hypothetical protein
VICEAVPNNNVLYKALKRVYSECGKSIFDCIPKFRSALADFLNGISYSGLRRRTVEAVELGVYKRLTGTKKSDLDRVAKVEIMKLNEDGIDKKMAQEIVFALVRLIVEEREYSITNDVTAKINDMINSILVESVDDWDLDGEGW